MLSLKVWIPGLIIMVIMGVTIGDFSWALLGTLLFGIAFDFVEGREGMKARKRVGQRIKNRKKLNRDKAIEKLRIYETTGTYPREL